MYEEREAELDRQDSLDTLEEERDRLAYTKAEKYGPKLITLAN